MDNLTPITREEMLMNDEPMTPITREEKILAGEDLNPVTRREYFLKKYRHAGGDVMVEGLEVTANGTYTAPEGKAYSPVEVDVPLPENAYLLKTASGSLVSFSDGADLPMPSFICNIDAVQDLHGYDAPWVGGAGKNKFPILIGDDVWVGNQGATYTSSNGVLIIESSLAPTNTSSGVYSSNNSKMRELIATLDGEYVYSFEIKGNKEASVTCGITNHGNIARPVSTNWIRYEIPTTFSIGENVGCVFYNYSKTENLEIQVRNFMIQQGTTATPYEPYENICPISGHTGVDAVVSPTTEASAGTTYSVSWQTEAGEVFGGYVDLVSGVLTVPYVYKVFTDDDANVWYKHTSGNRFYTAWDKVGKANTQTGYIDGSMCSSYKVVSKRLTTLNNGEIIINTSDVSGIKDNIAICDNNYDTAEAFKASLSTPLQIRYELATPITYQLTPHQIKSLVNDITNAWCSTGNVDVDYFAKEV